MSSLQQVPHARQAGGGDTPRRWRIPWRTLTKLFGFLAAFFGLLRVIIELWGTVS
jgi:hypothetical protein